MAFSIGTKKGRQELKDYVTHILSPATKLGQVKMAKADPKELLADAYEKLKAAYYSGTPVVDDKTFDSFEEVVLSIDKKLYKVGSTAHELNKAALPFGMGSMNKYLDEKSLNRWSAANPGPYVLSDKMDGISIGILGTAKPKAPKLYTRGDGGTGLDISHLAPYLALPPIKNGMKIRGEMIMSVSDFKAFAEEFANPRNMVAGAANRKTIHPAFKGGKIKVVAYQILGGTLKVADQFSHLKKRGFLIPGVKYIPDLTLPVAELTPYLLERKKKSKFEIDGIIVSTNEPGRNPGSGNPTWAFAFKSALTSTIATTTVTDVHWGISRYGAMKPRVEIEPVKLAGVTVKFATAHNAKFIKENKIGKEAVITLVRSGDVIPYITGVVTPAKVAGMPPRGTYEWDDNAVNILHVEETDEQLAKSVTFFFVTLGLEEFKQSTFAKVLNADIGVDSVQTLITKAVKRPRAFTTDLVEHAGFGAPTATKFVQAIQAIVQGVDLGVLMAASGAFGHGMGLTLLKPAAQRLGDPVSLGKTRAARTTLRADLAEMPGFGDKRAEQFVTLLPDFMTLFTAYTKAGLTYTLTKPPKKVRATSALFKGQRFYLTGIRDQAVNDFIVKNGGVIGAFSTSLTTTLIYKDGASNTKVNSFEGEKIAYSAFVKKYGIQ